MGIFVLEPEALDHIPDDGPFDFPDLVRRLLAIGERVGSYRHDGVWFDIGNHDDYVEAVEMWEQLQRPQSFQDGSSRGNRQEPARPAHEQRLRAETAAAGTARQQHSRHSAVAPSSR